HAHGRNDDAVGQLQRAESDGGEQGRHRGRARAMLPCSMAQMETGLRPLQDSTACRPFIFLTILNQYLISKKNKKTVEVPRNT
ncbi:MAG: hypothetical protein RR100_18245, partial [Comamonas sp.]